MKCHSRRFRLTLFGVLYFVQGVALAYFRNFQKPYLDGFGIDADTIGLLTSILLLPFIIKIFIGMLSDRVNLGGYGYRLPYIVCGLFLAVISFAAVSRVSPGTHFLLFSTLVIAGSFSVTLFDSATDGLAIDCTPVSEQGSVQGVMVGGRSLGFIVLSLIFGTIAQSQGYRLIFIIIAFSMLLPLWWILRVRETPRTTVAQTFDWRAFRVMLQPHILIFGLYAIFYSIVSFGVDGLVTYFIRRQFNAPETVIGTYGALRGLGAVIGAFIGGFFIDRIGRSRCAYIALILISGGAVAIGFSPNYNTVLILGIIWGIAWGFQETVFFALAMGLTDSRIAASMFAIMMAVSNIGTAIGEGLATGLTDNIGFRMVFLALSSVNLITLPIIWLLFRRIPPRLAARSAA